MGESDTGSGPVKEEVSNAGVWDRGVVLTARRHAQASVREWRVG